MNVESDPSPATANANAVPIVLPSSAPEQYACAERPKTCQVWGTDFAQLDMPQTVRLAADVVRARRPEYFVTANVNYLMLCEQYPRLHEVNEHSLAVIADGQPIVQRSRWTREPLPCRVAGADLIVELARLAESEGFRIFLLGAAPQVAEAAAAELLRRFPKLQIGGCYSPPFRQLTAAEHQDMLTRVREAQTDILLVAFGQPKGEFWIYDNLRELEVPLSIQIGASLDFLAGTARRAPAIWQRFGCEWLYRALSEPRRLLPRYAANIRFLIKRILLDLLGRKSERLA